MKTALTIAFILFESLVSAQKIDSNLFFKQVISSNIYKVDYARIKWKSNDIIPDAQFPDFAPGIKDNEIVRLHLSEKQITQLVELATNDSINSWSGNDLKDFKLLDSLAIDKLLRKSYNGKNSKETTFYRLSTPLLTVDKKYLLVKIEYNCGYMCSDHCTYLYRRTTGGWKKIAKLNCLAT
jgi:hypothetical protein